MEKRVCSEFHYEHSVLDTNGSGDVCIVLGWSFAERC